MPVQEKIAAAAEAFGTRQNDRTWTDLRVSVAEAEGFIFPVQPVHVGHQQFGLETERRQLVCQALLRIRSVGRRPRGPGGTDR